jgi:multidrug efflux system membrane fusion protein
MNHRILVTASFLVLALAPAKADRPRGAPQATPPAVAVSQPVQRQVTDFADFAGRTQAAQSVELRARATGYLTRVAFRDGAEVRKGDLLFEIDARPYQADLEKARASLVLAEARLKLAEASARRAKALAAVGKEELDKTEADRAAADAALRRARTDNDLAELMLSFTHVTAPINGHIGRRLLDVGNLVKADATLLATLVSEDPMYVYFDMDEVTLLRLRRAANAGRAKMPQAGQRPGAYGAGERKWLPARGDPRFRG